MANEITINALNPDTFELQSYSAADTNLIGEIQVDTSFSGSVTTGSISPDYIEFYIYDQNQNILFPTVGINTLTNYGVRDGDVLLNPINDLQSYNYAQGTYNVLYNFFRKRLRSDNFATYYISEISSDRTEIRLDSNIIENQDIIIATNQFIEYRESQDYFVDFYLNFGQNQTIIANNIQLDDNDEDDPTVLIKLYEPLPQQYNLKDELWVVEELSTPQAYQVNFPRAIIIEDDFTYLQGPNYSLEVRQETSTSGEGFSFNTLLKSNVTSSINQIKNLLNEKEININIDYENYSNFVHFSSAQTRLENFAYKAALIESASNQISAYLGQVTSDTTSSIAFSASLATVNNEIDTVIKNFDGYEAFLYFNSGSKHSWPKQNTEPPFVLFGTGSTEALEWLGSSDLTSSYYGGQALSASNYDQENRDWLFFSIPEYLRDDPQNQRYELFTDMVGQYYDNIWVYTKDLTNKFDADNRLEFGISQDLVADAIRDFNVKLYASNFNTDDLFTAFLGLTPSGSLFPFPTITGSLNPPTGFEYVSDKISASNDVVPLNDTQKQLYKRIYHNIPLTLKKKGTVGAIRALITSYGIPDTILRINEFGGKDRNEAHDYDLKQNVFNYAFDTTTNANRFVSSSWNAVNSKFEDYNGDKVPLCVQFRFKTAGIPTASNNVASSDIRYSQSLWIGKQAGTATGSLLVLEYTGSGFTSASFSGSVPSIYDNYGTLKFIPGANNSPTLSASIYLPFFDGNWWSVQLNHTGSSTGAKVTGSLFAANQINGVIGFTGSSEVLGYDSRGWNRNNVVFLNTQSNIDFQGQFYEPFSGSFQEYRFWNQEISQSNFYDYTANPFSNEGNGVDSTPDQLIFRADLGTQLNTASRTSIHPRVTGSAVQITQSFSSSIDGIFGSDFFANGPYVINREDIFQDQVLAGIKNRISDKIQVENNILAEAPYGLSTPTSSTATIASGDTTTLSPIESIQQESYVSQSYTPSVDYLEVGFSPSNQINDDINAQLGYFNLGDFIGDPRFQSSSDYTYPSLDILRNAYFEKYIKSYDIVDFIRLIKFFDNSLFKMIKDITPARTSLASGVIVKQHILERNRQRAAIASSSFHDYSGSIKPFPRDYNTGSSDFPQYSSTSGSSLVKVTGGAGGSFNRFNKICNNPFYSLNYLIPGSRLTNVTASASPNDGTFVFEIDSTPSSSFYNKAYIEITQGSDVILNTVIAQSASVAYNIETGETTGNVDATDLYQGLNIILGGTPGADKIVIPEYVQQVVGMVDDLGEGDIEIVLKSENVGTYDSCDITYFAGDSHPQRFNLTQSWSESIENSVINSLLFNRSSSQFISASFGGYDTKLHSDQSEFYDGIFSGSNLTIVTQSLNPAGLVYLKVADDTLTYNPLFFSFTSAVGGTTDPIQFQKLENNPVQGDVWIGSSQTSTDGGGVNTVQIIRIARNDVNGIEVGPFIQVGTEIEFIFTDASASGISGAVTYFVTGITSYTDSIILKISSTQGNPTFASSSLGGQENWSLSASGTYNTDGVESDTGDDFLQQGVFRNIESQNQNQNFFFYNQTPMADPQGFFNVGTNSGRVEADFSTWGTNGAYNPLRTSNSPWFFSGSATVSSSLLDASGQITSSAAIHKSASYQGTDLIDQDFTLGLGNLSGVFIPSPFSIDSLSANFFEPTYNTQIPGNMSGSEGQIGGHPKIKVGGTASLDFHFPALRIDGTFPSIIPPTPIFTPLSGSDLATNRPNQDFATHTFPYSSWFYSGSSANNARAADGAIGFQWAQAASLWSVTGGGFGKDPENIGEVELTISFDITASAPFTASLQGVEFEGGVPNGGGPITGSYTSIPGVPKFGYKSNSSNRVNQAGLSFTLEPSAFLDLNGGGIRSLGEYFRFAIKPNVDEQQFEYRFDDFEISNATWEIYWFSDAGEGPTNGTSSYVQSVATDGKPVDFTTYQNGQFGGINNQFTGSTISSGDSYPTVDINVLLKRTGSTSDGDTYDFIITSSKAQTFDVAEGASFHFTESPILEIKNFTGTGSGDTNTGSTINLANDMYYIEYSMSNFVPGVIGGASVSTVNVDFTSTSDTGSLILISQSIDGGAAGFDLTGSLRVMKGNIDSDPNTYGEEILAQEFIIPNGTTITPVHVSGSYFGNFSYNDTFTMNMEVSKSFGSGLVVNDYTFKIFPSSSNFCKFDDNTKMSSGSIALYNPILKVWNGPINNFKIPTNTQTILDTFFGGGVLPFPLYTDGQPLLNNYSNQRQNTYLMDVDYNNISGPIIPVNQALILSNSASKATVPDSNYTQLSSIFPRYLGSRSNCKLYNVFSYGDTGTLGQIPNIDIRNAFFGYFNNIQNPYPNINGVIRLNVTQLVDEGGAALPPSLSGFSETIFKEVFPLRSKASISVNSGSKELKGLEGQSTIFSVGNYPSPVCYSQTASNGHTSEIPLSGSGRISIYDNSGSAAAKTFYGMSALGPGGDGTNSFPSSTFSTVLKPSEAVETSSYNTTTTTVTAPYIPNEGVFRFSSSIDDTAGEDLRNPQQITVQTKVATGFIYESGGDEMELILRCVSGSTNIPFNFDDITLDAYYIGKKVNCGSLLGNVAGVDYRDGVTVRFVTSNINSSKNTFQDIAKSRATMTHPLLNYESNTAVLDDQNRVRMLIENAGLNELLINRGVNWKSKGGVERGGTVEALEFTIKAHTDVGFKAEDQIKFILEGTLREPKDGGGRANIFYPPSTPAEVVQFPTNFTVNGAYDDADGDNTASAPYWVYSQSVSKSIIEMSSSNFNEAYGTAWYQGQIPYIPGPSQYFEGGSEPVGTRFDNIAYPLIIQEGDQIRFVNNENYTYNIIKVTDPSENIVSNPGGERVGRVKLELDGEVPTSINKDFFLVRRPTTNANTVFINGDFPYANLITVENSSSGEVLTSGILYPDFPTNLISVSASSIVTNLISQGVIEP